MTDINFNGDAVFEDKPRDSRLVIPKVVAREATRIGAFGGTLDEEIPPQVGYSLKPVTANSRDAASFTYAHGGCSSVIPHS